MSLEKKICTLSWHCSLDDKAAFQSLAAIEGMTASELLDHLASDYMRRKVDEANLVLAAVRGEGTIRTERTDGRG